jgi:hypothetical protein
LANDCNCVPTQLIYYKKSLEKFCG